MTRTQLKKSIYWIVLENAVTILSAFVLIACARVIGAHAFGLASIAFFVGSLAETIIAAPFAESVIQRRHFNVRVVDTAHVSMVVFGLTVSLALCLLGPVIAGIFHEPELFPLIAVQGTTCFLIGLRSAAEAVIVRKLRFKALSLRNIAAKTASSLVYVVLALAGLGAWSLIISNVSFALICTIMIWSISRRKPKWRWQASQCKELFSFGFFSMMDALLWTGTARLFGFLAGYFHGVNAAGLLNIAFRINDALCGVISAVSYRIAFPYFSRIAHDPQRLRDAFCKGTRATFVIAAPAFAGLSLVGAEVIKLTLGAQWAAAAAALSVVSFFSLLNFSRLLTRPAIKALGRPSLLLWLNGIGLVFIAVGCTLTAHLDLNAQLYVWALYGFVSYIAGTYLLERASGISFLAQTAPLALGATGGLGMTTCLLFLQPHLAPLSTFSALVVEIFVGGISYAAIISALEWRTVSTAAGPYLTFLTKKGSRP